MDLVLAIAVRSLELRSGLTKDREQLAAGLLLEQTCHAGIHVGADVGDVDAEARMLGFLDDRLGGTVEAEPCYHEVVIATPVGSADQVLHLLGSDWSILGSEGDRHCRMTIRVGIRLPLGRPSTLCMQTAAVPRQTLQAAERHLLVVRESDTIHAKQSNHLVEVGFAVLRLVAPFLVGTVVNVGPYSSGSPPIGLSSPYRLLWD